MNFSLTKIFTRKPKKLKVKSMDLAEGRYRISEAFEVGGVMYYQFDDAKQIPADRAMAALTFYEEMNQRCTREYLEKH